MIPSSQQYGGGWARFLLQNQTPPGFTPNNDGVNDIWTIEDIELFPKNKVSIFNRWGVPVSVINGYNNYDNAWPDKSTIDNLPASTYFYVIELGDGSSPIKGWFELIKMIRGVYFSDLAFFLNKILFIKTEQERSRKYHLIANTIDVPTFYDLLAKSIGLKTLLEMSIIQLIKLLSLTLWH